MEQGQGDRVLGWAVDGGVVLSELESWTPEAGRCRRRIIAGR